MKNSTLVFNGTVHLTLWKSSLQISRFNQTLLLSLLLLVLLPYVFLTFLQFKFRGILLHSISLVTFLIGLLVCFSLILDIFRPFYFILKKLKPRQINSSMILKSYEMLCESFELVNKPSVIVSDVADSPFSLGIHRGKSMIIIPRYVLDFEEEEIESIIAHELWHIKTDVEAAYFWLFERVGSAVLLFSSSMALLTVIVEHEFLGWWRGSTIGIFPYTKEIDLFWLDVLLIFAVLLFFAYSFSLLAKLLRALSGFPVYLRPDYREYLADGSASLITKRPKTMARSLKKSRRCLAEKKIIETFVHKIGFINPRIPLKAKPRTWQEIFSSKFTKREHPSDKCRISFLHLMDSLLHSEVELIWKREPHKLKTRLLVSFLFSISFVNFGKIFYSIASEDRWKIINYMWENQNAFNLATCASETRVTKQGTLSVFWLLLSQGIIDVNAPKLNEHVKFT